MQGIKSVQTSLLIIASNRTSLNAESGAQLFCLQIKMENIQMLSVSVGIEYKKIISIM